MRTADHIAVLAADGPLLATAAERSGLDAAVPTCPGWRVADVLQHLAGVYQWATAYVESGRRWPFDKAAEAAYLEPVAEHLLFEHFQARHRALVSALGSAPDDLACWAFLPAPSPLAFWARRQAHETAVHRADVESAGGTTPDWAPQFGVDGVEELLRGFFVRPGRVRPERPFRLGLEAVDGDASWTVTVGGSEDDDAPAPAGRPPGVQVRDGLHASDLVVRGPATALYLLLWNRLGADRVELAGDPAVLELWRSAARVTWS